jgi:hypothetical protein
MTVLYPGDQVHITFWYNATLETPREAYDKVRPTFEGNGVHIYSWSAYTGSPFPTQVIAFRKP